MFTNINGKVKGLAKVICVLGIVASVISGISIMAGGSMMSSYSGYGSNTGVLILIGLLVIVLGSVCSWAGSLALYAFGEMGENVEAIRRKTEQGPMA